MCPVMLKFIININQCIKVKWNNGLFERSTISNGVKQGRVMSPLLFNLYMQDLIECLFAPTNCYIVVLVVTWVIFSRVV